MVRKKETFWIYFEFFHFSVDWLYIKLGLRCLDFSTND